MAFNLRSNGMVALVLIQVWMLMCYVDGSTTFRPGNSGSNGVSYVGSLQQSRETFDIIIPLKTNKDAVGLEGIPDVLDPNDERALGAASTPAPEANEINCHFTLHQRSRVGGRCMSIGSQLIKTCVASIIYFDTENSDCINA